MSVRLSSKARETKLATFPLLIAFLTKVFVILKKAVFFITVIIERSSKKILNHRTRQPVTVRPGRTANFHII